MPWMMQAFGAVVMFIGIAIALWIGIWLLLALFTIGVVMVIWMHLRDYLLRKGILNPTPGVPPEGVIIEKDSTTTVIEGEYMRIESDEKVKPDA